MFGNTKIILEGLQKPTWSYPSVPTKEQAYEAFGMYKVKVKVLKEQVSYEKGFPFIDYRKKIIKGDIVDGIISMEVLSNYDETIYDL